LRRQSCPKTDSLMLVRDELEQDADAALASIEHYSKTGRKEGQCDDCSYVYEGEFYPVIHQFGARTAPKQELPF
jgi:hypothetical protein